jgi:hypothetical protein
MGGPQHRPAAAQGATTALRDKIAEAARLADGHAG